MYSFDIETFWSDKKMNPYCITLYSEHDSWSFYGENCIDNFILKITTICEKKKEIILFSHNLTFDGSILIQNIKTNDIKINGLFFKGNIYSITIINKKKKIIMKCSYRFFPNKLENANKLLDCSKKIEFSHKNINSENINSIENEAKRYCMMDSKIVYEIINKYNNILSKYIKEWMLESNSISAISLKIFEKKFNEFNLSTSNSSEFDFTFRSSYYGGRCEVFGNQKKDEIVYHFDFTGMYAQVMTEDFEYGNHVITKEPEKFEKKGFYYIEAESNNDLPVLPTHVIDNNKLLFMNGTIKGLYWWEEIELFLKKGGIIKKIFYKIEFEKKEKIFKNFVETFTNERKKSKENNIICKMIVNSIYGRMGMAKNETKTKLLKMEEYIKFRKKNEKLIIKEHSINNLIFVEYEKENRNNNINSNVAIASIITSKARIKLYKGFESVIKEGGRLLYTDTDSIFVAFEKNVDNKKFGDVVFDTKKNDTKIKKALFALPKAYSIIWYDGRMVTKIKGTSVNSMTYKDFKKLMFKNKRKKVILEILKKSNFIISPTIIEKIIKLDNYDKRIFSKDKKTTTPIKINK